jgi:S-formylglutathione hydrolase FrmB
MEHPKVVRSSLAFLSSCALLATLAGRALAHGEIEVSLAADLGPDQSGRVIVFAKPLKPGATAEDEIDFDVASAEMQWIAAREISGLNAGERTTIDADTGGYPGPLSSLAPGSYELQAVLDRNHDYAYGGRSAGDLVSSVVTVTLPGQIPTLILEREVPSWGEAGLFTGAARWLRAQVTTWTTPIKPLEFKSQMMTQAHRAPTFIHGWLALPPGYDSGSSFPTVYAFAGFGNTLQTLQKKAAAMAAMMADGSAPPMIWVYLDYAVASGTHEFADSANNGPWGQALTAELIPALERQYKMDARSSGRFLMGHSSGGWASLWLQVRYPRLFGGAWPTSPDPADFHDFFHVDLYRAGVNLYHGADGEAYPLTRATAHEAAFTLEKFARSEAVLGSYGGQMASFEWTYSPRGPNGQPAPLFKRDTGEIDPAVAAYWCENYDVAHIIVRDWDRLKPDLDGKIHLTVGTADTYYLDGPAHGLESAMRSVGAQTDFRYVPGKNHNDLYAEGEDRNALSKRIAWEIYAQARPDAKSPAH